MGLIMQKQRKYIITILILFLLSILHTNTIVNNKEVNNCRSIIEYNDLKQVESIQYFNEADNEIYNPIFPNIIKTPDLYNENNKKTGAWTIFLNRSFRPEEKIELAQYYRNATYDKGLPIGIVRDYFIDGSKQFEGMLLSEFPSVYQDTIRIYAQNGKLKWQRGYDKGVHNGFTLRYGNDGKLRSNESYSKGKKDGYNSRFSYRTGHMIEKVLYKDGNLYGLSYYYYEDTGNIKHETTYKRNQLHGYQRNYYKNGNLISEGNWSWGRKHGFWKFYIDGNISNVINFNLDKKIEPLNLRQIGVFNLVLQIFLNQYPNVVHPVRNSKWDIEQMLPELMKYINSDIEVYKVYFTNITNISENVKSTLGIEIMYIIEGYLDGIYPPSCGRENFNPMIEKYITWWETYKDDLNH